MNKFAFIPLPLPEESPTSMLRRFALRHGCEYPADLVNLTRTINFKCSATSSEGPLAQWIAERAGCYAERFLDGFYKPVGRFTENMPFRAFGTLIPNALIRFSGIAFCSACRAEGHDRFVKDLRPALYCPYHCRQYLFKCPCCDRHLTWINPIVDKCTCGHTIECPECVTEDCAPEQLLRTMVLENQDDVFQQLKQTLTQLHYDTNSSPGNFENRQIFKAALAIVTEDIASVEAYLSSLQSQHPEMPGAAIGAKLARIKTPVVRDALRHYSDWTLPLSSAPSDDLIAHSHYTLYKSQVRETSAVRASVLRTLATEHCREWIDAPNTMKIPPAIFLPLLEKCRAWKADARKDFTDPAHFVTVEDASHMIMVKPYFIHKLVDNGDLCPLRKANQKLRIKRVEVDKFLEIYESINSIAIRLNVARKHLRKIIDRHNLTPVSVARVRRPTIYRRQDVDAMIRLWGDLKTRSRLRNLDGIDISLDDISAYCTFQKAANTLKIDILILRDYALAGLFPTYNHPSRGCHLMARRDVDCFHENYVLPDELGRLIGVGTPVAARTLRDLGNTSVLQGSLDESLNKRRTRMALT